MTTEHKREHESVIAPDSMYWGTPIEEAMRDEHEAWQEMCKTLEAITGESINLAKYRPLVEKIEKWAHFDLIRRFALLKHGNEKQKAYATDNGLFWKGD